MIRVSVENTVKEKLSGLALGLIYARVRNSKHNETLWKEIDATAAQISKAYKLEEVKNQPNISAAREAYRALGKDPNRYRPSAEALFRRILKGSPLYRISTLVDIVNLVSLKTGYSINGFDADKISGDISLGLGKDEPFDAIGRGELNIENLPVYRDGTGPIGSPTSDHVRTAIWESSGRIFFIVNDFKGNVADLKRALDLLQRYVTDYADASDLSAGILVADN